MSKLAIDVDEPSASGLFRDNANQVPNASVRFSKRRGGKPFGLLLKYVFWSLFLTLFWVPITLGVLAGERTVLLGLVVLIPHTCLLFATLIQDLVPNRYWLVVEEGAIVARSTTWDAENKSFLPKRQRTEAQVAFAQLARFRGDNEKLLAVSETGARTTLFEKVPELVADEIAKTLNDAYDLT